MTITLQPIGRINCSRAKPVDDHWKQETSTIILDSERVERSATAELSGFSHIDVLFYFDQVLPEKIQRGSRRLRNNPA